MVACGFADCPSPFKPPNVGVAPPPGARPAGTVRRIKIATLPIRAFEQVELDNVSRLRVQLGEADDEFAREVLIEQQFHRATRRPSMAANSSTARKSPAPAPGNHRGCTARHAGGEPILHVPYCHGEPADARLAGAFAWLDRDSGTHPSGISLARRSGHRWMSSCSRRGGPICSAVVQSGYITGYTGESLP
jgi:hypothetical protein